MEEDQETEWWVNFLESSNPNDRSCKTDFE